MARPLLPDDLWTEIAPLLPPSRPRPKGGRPSIENRAALTGVLFVLRSGIPLELLPAARGSFMPNCLGGKASAAPERI